MGSVRTGGACDSDLRAGADFRFMELRGRTMERENVAGETHIRHREPTETKI